MNSYYRNYYIDAETKFLLDSGAINSLLIYSSPESPGKEVKLLPVNQYDISKCALFFLTTNK